MFFVLIPDEIVMDDGSKDELLSYQPRRYGKYRNGSNFSITDI